MTEEDALEITRESVLVLLAMAGPIMGIALAVGLLIALFQALTQLQEMTLVFVPKIIVVFASLLLLLPFMLAQISTFFRSEEHTSELQSLMRISYAVFCLKKKKHNMLNTTL